MNTEKPKYPPGWTLEDIRNARTAFMIDLLNNAPLEGPRVPLWAILRVRELNKATLAAEAAQDTGPAGSHEDPGGSTPAPAAVILPFPAPELPPLPPVAVGR